jgi:hypothetical protein
MDACCFRLMRDREANMRKMLGVYLFAASLAVAGCGGGTDTGAADSSDEDATGAADDNAESPPDEQSGSDVPSPPIDPTEPVDDPLLNPKPDPVAPASEAPEDAPDEDAPDGENPER